MASVSTADSAVIRRVRFACSNTSSVCSSAFSLRALGSMGLRPSLLIRRRATGPPIKPPNTKPNVAEAIPNPVAPTKPNLFSKSGPHAPAVPCPPVRVIEPVIRPISGSSPKTFAKPTPTKFCTMINAPTTAVKITNGRPPAFRREKSALKPIEVKKISMNASCSGFSNLKLTP